MAINTVILVLFLGGFTGWALFALTILHSLLIHRKQLDMVDEIADDLEKVKQEIKELK
jgi:hypothetical protein